MTDTTISPRQGLHAVEQPRSRRFGRGLRTFVRRSPLSAFWGCIAAAIVFMALAAPYLAPYEPLKSDFRSMSKPPDARHYFTGKYAPRGKTVAELVQHMTEQGLQFAPSVMGDEDAYLALHRALAACDMNAQAQLAADR